MPINIEPMPGLVKRKNYYIATSEQAATKLLDLLNPNEYAALDFETTSLYPRTGAVRLSSIAQGDLQFIIDHFKAPPFEEMAQRMAQRKWAVFNACFEGKWFVEYCDFEQEIELLDVQFLRKAKLGGAPLSLAIMAKRDLNIELDKTEQDSAWWEPELTNEQYDYAIFDAVVTYRLFKFWWDDLTADQIAGAFVINDAWRANVEMESTGFYLDVPYHRRLVALWQLRQDTAKRYFERWTPPSVIPNINSKKQVSDFLKQELDETSIRNWPKTDKTGDLKLDRSYLRYVASRLPYPMNRWLASYIIYNYYSKYTSTYGAKLIDMQERHGAIYCRFNMAQAATGRYSSSEPNMQNIPKRAEVRRSFIAPPVSPKEETIMFVMADYKAIEVRVLAELSKDETLLHDAIYGDPHSRSASQIYGIDFDEFTAVIHGDNRAHDNIRPHYKSLRSKAKAFTFQLLYGAGATALAAVLKCSDEEAHEAINAWAAVYPRAYNFRQYIFEVMHIDGFIPVCDGRTIYLRRDDRTLPVAANYPIQGAAASVMYRALYHIERKLRLANLKSRMVGSIHDEVLLYARERHAEKVKTLMVEGMRQGWLDIFPGTNTDNLFDPMIGSTWADKP